MAITSPHYRILREIQPMLPRGGTLLEIGEAEWYGEIEPDFPCDGDGFAVAKAMYAELFAPSQIVSIDMGGTEAAIKLDLNERLPSPKTIGAQFDVVVNHGTAEHIFNIAQVFRTMHDACDAGGLMLHECPCQGWLDHGFYCLQPTLFYDLARANNYEVSRVYVTEIQSDTVIRMDGRDHFYRFALPPNAMLFVVLRKICEQPFKIPTQGYYGRELSAAGCEAWRVNR
jgi:SAM-dependent methyltransferase